MERPEWTAGVVAAAIAGGCTYAALLRSGQVAAIIGGLLAAVLAFVILAVLTRVRSRR